MLGSNSEGVRALQVFLNSNGYVIATAGPGSKGSETTYFGGLTRVALARYQAAKGISPAAGYFGPVTRAKVNAECMTTNPGTNPGGTSTSSTSTGALQGGEADLSNFTFRREDASGAEGESDVEFATARFDVDDADIRVERIELIASSTDPSFSVQPWRYIERIAVLADGREIASEDTDTRADWNEVRTGVYRLAIGDIRHVVREGDTAELTFSADIRDNIDSANLAQEFAFSIADRGIRVRDAAGIDQYVGDSSDIVAFGFDSEQNGDLRVSSSNEDPDASILVADRNRESAEYAVFSFDIENKDDVDAVLTDLSIGVTGLNPGVSASDVIRRATLVTGRDRVNGDVSASSIDFDDIDIAIDGDDSLTLELRVRLVRNATSTPIAFAIDGADIEAEGVRSGDDAEISGSAASETHTVAFSGISVTSVSSTARTLGLNDTVGQYVIQFRVTALEDDAYIATTSDTTGTVGVTYAIGGNAFTGGMSSMLTSSAQQQNGFYRVSQGSTETFTLTVSLDPDVQGSYSVNLDEIRFGENASFAGSIGYDTSSNQSFRTPVVFILN